MSGSILQGLFLVTILSAAEALSGCAAARVPGSSTTASTAGPKAVPAASIGEYMAALGAVKSWDTLTNSGEYNYIHDFHATSNESEVAVKFGNGYVSHCRYKDTPNPVITFNLMGHGSFGGVNCRGEGLIVWDADAELKRRVSAWLTLLAGPPLDLPEQGSAFDAVAAKFRADSSSHILPEEARAFKIQAETAVREKRNLDAVDRFSKALDVSPCWAQGRFNLALIYGELDLPVLAAAEMSKYLKLAPDAPNARADQDKIYVWQDLQKR